MMKKVIRHGVFETNSSSMHSISIKGEDSYNKFNEDVIVVYPGEFGWGYEELHDPYDKLSYVLTAIQYYDDVPNTEEGIKSSIFYKWLQEMIRDYCGAELEFRCHNKGDYYEAGYIDHESIYMLSDDVWVGNDIVRSGFWSNDEETFKENMKELIFNDKYYIIIDNDNH